MELRGRKIPRSKEKTVKSSTPPPPPPAPPQSNGIRRSAPSSPPPLFLSPITRLYIYALHGLLCELVFTSFWDLPRTRDLRLLGHSSLWSLPMYSLALLAIEKLRNLLLSRNTWLPFRLVAYTLFIYLWELSWGAGLTLLRACPWDYSGFTYNFKGLVTLEYAPFWAVAALIAEKFVIKNTLRFQI
ncbi:unnamed protein product [Knipowitschia caucasica]|uniref:Transmembrane protein 229B n=1 Tax=Knipowitschia caucasica TaxID=637954 RepID=A0AAV2JMA3_KNICA